MIIVVVFIIAMQRRMRLAWEILVSLARGADPRGMGGTSVARGTGGAIGGEKREAQEAQWEHEAQEVQQGWGGCCPRWDCRDSWGPGISHWTNRRNRDGVGSSE